jgi:hypothetical protein
MQYGTHKSVHRTCLYYFNLSNSLCSILVSFPLIKAKLHWILLCIIGTGDLPTKGSLHLIEVDFQTRFTVGL